MGRYGLGVQPPGEGCGYLNLGFEFGGQATDCMERITVEMVAAAADEMVSKRLADTAQGGQLIYEGKSGV